MKKIIKRLLPLILCGFVSLSALTACGEEKTGPSTPVNPGPSIVNPTQPENPSGPQTPVEPEKPTWTTEAYDDVVAKLQAENNFKCTITADGKKDIYDIDGDIVRFRENGDRVGVYYYSEGTVSYQLKAGRDGYYHKTYADKVDADSVVLGDMKNAVITDYDATTSEYSVKLGGVEYSMVVSDSSVKFENESKKMVVDNYGEVELELPDASLIKNDIPSVGPEIPVTGNQLFVVENGKNVYNEALVKKTLKAALNSKTASGQILASEVAVGVKSVEDVKYFVVSNSEVEFGATTVSVVDNADSFCIFKFDESVLTSAKTDEALSAALLKDKAISGKSSGLIEYSTDSKVEGQMVLTAAQNLLAKLAADGVQAETIGVKGKPVEYLAGENVKYAYSAVTNYLDGSGYGMGSAQFARVFIVTESNIRLTLEVAASDLATTNTALETVALGAENTYLVHKMDSSKESSQAKTNVAKSLEAVGGKSK